ncbi:MAG: Oxaloacetate decarboxylase beta chain [Deltaproteobacteria bacterium]|nr:Oxaloacetate decarboxylase beta chain [Deltaproteobacteria bacterium]
MKDRFKVYSFCYSPVHFPRKFKKFLIQIFSVVFILCLSGTVAAQSGDDQIKIVMPTDARVIRLDAKIDQWVFAGDTLAVLKDSKGAKFKFRAGVSGQLVFWRLQSHKHYGKGETVGILRIAPVIAEEMESGASVVALPSFDEMLLNLFNSTGTSGLIRGQGLDWTEGFGRLIMIGVGLTLLYLGIRRQFEPLLLVPIGFGAVLSNIPLAGLSEPGGLLFYIYEVGISTGIFPLIIFMGVGAMTDFGPMLANPKTALLGGAAQFGIFGTLLGALALNAIPGIDFSLRDAASIGIIGGADGPTAIFLASQLSPRLLGSIAIAAYSYMALVPLIQPPIMRWLTSQKEREIEMTQLRYVSTREKILFPLVTLTLCALLLPSAAPLIGMFMFGNLAKECGVIKRLSDTIQKSLINIVTIFLGLSVGSKLAAGEFLNIETVGILILGVIAFSVGTATGVLMAKLMNNLSSAAINPLIGAAGVSAVPMAARVVNQVGLKANSQNHLLMHAMGPNVSGVIGSAVAAGVLLAML